MNESTVRIIINTYLLQRKLSETEYISPAQKRGPPKLLEYELDKGLCDYIKHRRDAGCIIHSNIVQIVRRGVVLTKGKSHLAESGGNRLDKSGPAPF